MKILQENTKMMHRYFGIDIILGLYAGMGFGFGIVSL
jgi:hypothetical protein